MTIRTRYTGAGNPVDSVATIGEADAPSGLGRRQRFAQCTAYQRTLVAALVLAMCTLSLATSSPAKAKDDQKVANPHSISHGRSLAGWLREYWIADIDTGAEGDGNVLFMPIPEGVYMGEGDFTPDNPGVLEGTADVTIGSGTPFVLPLNAWVGESTDPTGQCDPVFDDPSLPDELFGSDDINAVVTLDGLPIVEDNQAFYVPRTDLGCITTGYPNGDGFTAAVFFQAIGFLANPLPPGQHTLTLDGNFIIRDPMIGVGTFGLKFFNTWNITVEP
jgi:hypothetical protein